MPSETGSSSSSNVSRTSSPAAEAIGDADGGQWQERLYSAHRGRAAL
jgi:hypothetical protein